MAGSVSAAAPPRRRISHACDQCHELRTKCNGQRPCSHCIDYRLSCGYVRKKKKRGKAAKKPNPNQGADQSGDGHHSKSAEHPFGATSQVPEAATLAAAATLHDFTSQNGAMSVANDFAYPSSFSPDAVMRGSGLQTNQSMPDYGDFHELDLRHPASLGDTGLHFSVASQLDSQSRGAYSHSQPSPGSAGAAAAHVNAVGSSPGESSGRDHSSPRRSAAGQHGQTRQQAYRSNSVTSTMSGLRYPALQPVATLLSGIMPMTAACDLLEFYFASSWSTHVHPMSPYILGFVLRKASFLHATEPRPCQPALLASMLWVAALTSDLRILTNSPDGRKRLCQDLERLTLKLLQPSVHVATGAQPAPSNSRPDGDNADTSNALARELWQFDNIITYIHIAVIASASEHKGESIKWWSMAWVAARQLKLNQEIPTDTVANADASTSPADDEIHKTNGAKASNNTEPYLAINDEQREERRRVWWLLYAVDRHLALCYNRPLTLLDAECKELLQPMDETSWQDGHFGSGDGMDMHVWRRAGPQIECTSHSIFGYFVPLMTILGDIIDLQRTRNHPRVSKNCRSVELWEVYVDEIRNNLHAFEQSLNTFEERHLADVKNGNDSRNYGSNHSAYQHVTGGNENDPFSGSERTDGMAAGHASSRITESEIHTRIVVAYSKHVLHVLHILLAGKWDPVSLFEDNDPWISTQNFLTATSHATAAADEIATILQFDRGLDFMPFFWGIYLLQGSFLLLLIADMLQYQTSPQVIKACETVTQANEACVVTLHTEYQRDFSKLMRTAIASIRGRVPHDLDKHCKWRRDLLSRYRWTGDGTGLAQ